MYGDASRSNGAISDSSRDEGISAGTVVGIKDGTAIAKNYPITVKASNNVDSNIADALGGVRSLFHNRITALDEWSNASVPFQYSWATPQINTGNPRLDQYFLQPASDVVNTVANAGWNTFRAAGNAATLISNSPAAFFSAFSGDYDESQRTYDDLLFSNPATTLVAGGARAGLGYIRDVREFNKATTVVRMIGSSQRGSVSVSLLNDIPTGSTTGEVLTATTPASPIKALYPSTARVGGNNSVPNFAEVDQKLIPNVPFYGLKVSKNKEIESFIENLYRKNTPTHNAAGLFEIEQTGSYNYRVVGGGTAIDIDGYLGTTMLDSKFVEKPMNSPYVVGSKVPEFLRTKIMKEQQYEIQRYKAIIDDETVPFKRLDILTNEPKAQEYFQTLMNQYHVPGTVKVVKTNIPQVFPKETK